jgi:hypothetical protein
MMSARSQNTVFQFQGVGTSKEPRVVKPGEVLFSATGSPVAVQQEDSVFGMAQALTGPSKNRRPVRLQVENPDGRVILL